MFKITDGRGFQMTFPNHCTISVQFGPGNYTDAEIRKMEIGEQRGKFCWKAQTAEVAILLPNGEFHPLSECDDVVGWKTVEEVVAFIDIARNIDTSNIPKKAREAV
jgi:hypothetical protein